MNHFSTEMVDSLRGQEVVQPRPRPPRVPSLTLQIETLAEKKLRTFEQRHLVVPKQARYAIMGSFEGELSEVWIVCHGHGQLATRFLSRFLPLERADRLFIAPEALSRYYLAPPVAGPHA